jgi:hypothetical protein
MGKKPSVRSVSSAIVKNTETVAKTGWKDAERNSTTIIPLAKKPEMQSREVARKPRRFAEESTNLSEQ